jgi:hypothetical protein
MMMMMMMIRRGRKPWRRGSETLLSLGVIRAMDAGLDSGSETVLLALSRIGVLQSSRCNGLLFLSVGVFAHRF